ncbi:MAG: hypothetical protein V3S19_01365 [Gemmatimonadales bacterium]
MNVAFARTLIEALRERSHTVVTLSVATFALLGWSVEAAQAQQWRGRFFTRVQYVDAQPFRLDSVPIDSATGAGRQRLWGRTTVACEPAANHCFFYTSDPVVSTAPVIQDFDLNIWGFGVEGLRAYVNTRFRTALGDEEFWPRTDDHFDLLNGYLELRRASYRVRVGRDYQVTGLGYYGYDGGSVEIRLGSTNPVEFEAYGGWGLERGIPETATSKALASLEEFQARERNLLLGFRASVRPARGTSIEAVYQREIDKSWENIASERVAVDATYYPSAKVSFQGHADYDLATGWWGKAGATVGWSPASRVYVEGRVFRYRPVFSLQTIWAVFTPVPYTGYGATVGLRPLSNLSVRVSGERHDYAETDAEVFFQSVTERTWRASTGVSWQPKDKWSVDGTFTLNYTAGSALNAGDLRVSYRPRDNLTLGASTSAFQQVGEYRVGDGRVFSAGANFQWRSDLATVWGSIDRYRHDRRNVDVLQPDWSQTRASLGLTFYVGSEPGRAR